MLYQETILAVSRFCPFLGFSLILAAIYKSVNKICGFWELVFTDLTLIPLLQLL